MSRKRKTKVISYHHRPIPEPPDKSLGSGVIFLIASFFNNTQSLDLEVQDGASKITFNYKGFGNGDNVYRRRK